MRTTVPRRILATVALLTVTACSNSHEPATSVQPPPVVVKGVTLETVASTPSRDSFEMVGTVRARTSAVVSARVPGMISMLKVREGDVVRKGDLLARIEAQENSAGAASALAGVDEAHRGLDEATSRKKLVDATFNRYQQLYKEQAISRQEFDVRQTEQELATQGLARAEARLKQAQEGSRAASAMADYTKITAPISGVITVKQAELGATVFPAQPLMTIEDGGSFQLELAIPESLSSQVRPGTPVQVTLETLNVSFPAKIAEVVPTADPVSRTFMAKVNLNQKGMRSGMFGRAAISTGASVPRILVPAKAIVEKGALNSVWVVDKDNIVRMRLIKPGKVLGDRTEILSGLSAGDRIAITNTANLIDGAKVE